MQFLIKMINLHQWRAMSRLHSYAHAGQHIAAKLIRPYQHTTA